VLQFARVAQLTVPLASGRTGVGSGYLLAERLVLTAGHVVDGLGDAVIAVEFPAAGATAAGAVLWSGSADGLDAALVELDGTPRGPLRIRVSAVRWGRLTGQRPRVEAAAVGFPRALKDSDGTRVPDQVDGAVNPGTGFGERYNVNLSGAHPLADAKDASPWAGAVRRRAVLRWAACWRGGDRHAEVSVGGCAQRWESVELAGLFERARGRLDSPASLLRADTAVVRFRGRDRVLADLWSWAEDADDRASMLVVGPRG
jgi:hypothetical protein